MSSKTDVLAKVTNSSQYLGSFVKQLINEIHCDENRQPPTIWKKGDVLKVNVQRDGTIKPRPSVVIRVKKEYLISIPLTSSDDVNFLCESTGSRFFKDSNFCNTYVVTPIEKANESFLGVYDSPKSLNNAIKELRKFINENI
jgi:hypothetical protein